MAKQRITIGEETFTLEKGKFNPQIRWTDIYNAYTTPSTRKIAIFNSWIDWFIRNSTDGLDYMGITSRNCNIFTLGGKITIGDKVYTFYITPTYNKLFEV